MKKIFIDKPIGANTWGYDDETSAAYVREELDRAIKADGVQIVINSPGGDVLEGIALFNVIRDFARGNPAVEITTYIQGMAASMASVCALAANSVNPAQNKIIAEDNSVFMIHDAWGVCIGNTNDMATESELLSRIDGVLREVYAARTGKGADEIKALMDAESWYFGAEIRDAGFCDSIIQGAQEPCEKPAEDGGKAYLTALAKANYSAAAAHTRERAERAQRPALAAARAEVEKARNIAAQKQAPAQAAIECEARARALSLLEAQYL